MVSSTARETAPRAIAATVNELLAAAYPDARCELDYSTPLELVIATVLSAQCTDKRVNQITPQLFRRYPTAADYARARPADLEAILRPLGFQRAKAKHLIGIGEKLIADYDGQVPQGLDDLVALPGVGRKTALVVRSNAFGLPGLAVDTHVARVTTRLGLTAASSPLAIEKDLCSALAPEEWTAFSHRVIFHGRRVCHARNPECDRCVLSQVCPAANVPRG